MSHEFKAVEKRYQFLAIRGRGSYGLVCEAFDKKTGKKVAIKKIGGIFHNLVLLKRLFREIYILRQMNHDNVIELIDLYIDGNVDCYQNVYLVMNLMYADCGAIIQSEQVLLEPHIQYIMYQILHGLAYIHSARILHRDIKPGNILLNKDASVRLCDLGLAVPQHEDMSSLVVTRWYRPPELLIFDPTTIKFAQYTTAVDMWSVGCILAEMYCRRPIFQGSNTFDQLKKIVEGIGPPSNPDLYKSYSNASPKNMEVLQGKSSDPNLWSYLGKQMSANGLDLIKRLLEYDPKQRITAEDALKHPFFQCYPYQKPVICMAKFDFNHETDESMSPEQYRILIYREYEIFQQNELFYDDQTKDQLDTFFNSPLPKSIPLSNHDLMSDESTDSDDIEVD